MDTIYAVASLAIVLTFAMLVGPILKVRTMRREAKELGASKQPSGGLNIESIAEVHARAPTSKSENLLSRAREVYPTYIFRMRVFLVVLGISAFALFLENRN